VHLGRSDTPEEIQKKLQRDPDLFLVAEADNQIVGTVIGGFDGRRGMVYHLAVSEACRRLGVGTALMDELERRLKAKGCLKAYLMVVPDNDDAPSFYEKCGWQVMDVKIFAKEFS
jgi:ribosomal protein S18 acetylase RimI-like enzyme